MTDKEVPGDAGYNIDQFDECECGDYRSQHEDGQGECRVCRWNPVVPNQSCLKFKLAKSAKADANVCPELDREKIAEELYKREKHPTWPSWDDWDNEILKENNFRKGADQIIATCKGEKCPECGSELDFTETDCVQCHKCERLWPISYYNDQVKGKPNQLPDMGELTKEINKLIDSRKTLDYDDYCVAFDSYGLAKAIIALLNVDHAAEAEEDG